MATGPKSLRAWRKSQNLTLAEAAEKVGVSHSLWAEWEGGTRKPPLERALAIETATARAVPIETWGFDVSALAAVMAARSAPTPPEAA